MDYDRCLTATSSRYYDSWYTYPGPALPTYPIRDQQDYPSPAPSCSDPSPASRTHHILDSYTSDFSLAPFNQMDSSIGPLRSTRRHTSLRQSAHTRRLSPSLNTLREQDASLQCTGAHMPDDILTRTESPSVGRYGDRSTPTLPSISPSLYQPNTPVSMPSPFSPYDPTRRSRARSSSNSDHPTHSPSPRSKSPHTSPPSPRAVDSPVRVESSTRDLAAAPTKKRERHHKHKLCDQDRKAICIYHIEHPNARQEDIGTVFGVERSTISKILKDKDRWLKISDDDQTNDLTSKHRPSKFPEVEFEMVKSLQQWADRGESITDQLIRQRALEIARSFGMAPEKFKGSSGWIENFKHRHDIRRGEWLKARATTQPAGPSAFAAGPSALASYDHQRMPTTGNRSNESHFKARSSSWDTNTSQSGDMAIDPSLQEGVLHPHGQSMAPIQHSPTVTYGIRYGTPLLHTREETPPTLAQAEQALNVLLAYLDTTGQHLCKPEEREVLHHLKCAMFQHASGIPYERPSS